MAKKSIIRKNKRTLTAVNELDEKIFSLLLNSYNKTPKKVITQKMMAEAFKKNQSTISRHMRKLTGREYNYAWHYFKIVYVNQGYKMIKQERPSRIKPNLPVPIEYRMQELEIKESGALEIRNNECLMNNGVVDLGDNLIQYKVKKSKNDLVINVLRSGFPEHYFHDIISNSNGVYIILNSESLGARLASAKKDIIDFYTQILAKSSLYWK